MKKLSSLLRWLDENILKVLVIGFIFIVPLYPKLPFIDLEYTYIYIRLEDFYVGLMTLAYLVQLVRRKLSPPKNFAVLFGLFWMAVFASFAWGYWVQGSIPVMNIGFLHAARRVEYMMVFFIAFASVTSRKDLWMYTRLILYVFFIVAIYGIGQRFIGLPAVQTMNPEYARGHILYLTPEARISSTFGGHYDLAMYIVFLMPVALGALIATNNLVYLAMFAVALFDLILTASRISAGAYLVTIFPFIVLMRKWWLLIVVIAMSIGVMFLDQSLLIRFSKTFQIKQILVNEETGQVIVPQKITTDQLPAGSFYVPVSKAGKGVAKKVEPQQPPPNATTDPTIQANIIDQIREDQKKKGKALTASQEAELAQTLSKTLKPLTSFVSDISFATRIQVEWPRAINSFMTNPILGTGPSSITEATDNDYLRWIGEFGALGTLLFLAILFLVMKQLFLTARRLQDNHKPLYWGLLFGFVALLIDATYFDVFEASKVAYQFWLIIGIYLGSIPFLNAGKKK